MAEEKEGLFGKGKFNAWWNRTKRKYLPGRWKESLGKTPVKTSDVIRDFRELGLLRIMQFLNKAVIEIEDRWNEDEDFGDIRKEAEKGILLVGPFPNLKTYVVERNFYRYGTAAHIAGVEGKKGGLKKKEKKSTFKRIFENMDWVNINIAGEIFKFPIPPEVKWKVAADSDYQYLRTWGFEFFEEYEKELNKIMDDIQETLKQKFEGTGEFNEKGLYKKDEELKNALTHLGYATDAMRVHVFSHIFEKMNEEEKSFRRKYDPIQSFYETSVKGIQSELEKRTPKMMGRIHCAHTYRVITQTRVSVKNKVKKLTNDKDKDFFQRDGERGLGLDRNGMPLEVGDDRTILADKWEQELIDNKMKLYGMSQKEAEDDAGFKKPEKIRELKKKEISLFTDMLPIWDIVEYVHNEWDRFRDDCRDGRYHLNSLTISEYLMAMQRRGREKKEKREEIKEKEDKQIYKRFWKWAKDWPAESDLMPDALGNNMKDEEEFRKSQEKVNKLRSFRMQTWGEGMKKMYEDGLRTSDNLIPCFDLRALKYIEDWEHAGTIYYYGQPEDVASDILPPEKQPHITSRGIAMYMLFKLFKEEKYTGDIIKICKHISGKTNGFDYGPRTFGEELIKNPFDAREIQKRIESLNTMQKKYVDMVAEEIGKGEELMEKM